MLFKNYKFNRLAYGLFVSLLCLGLVAILVMGVITGLQSALRDVHISPPVVNQLSAFWQWRRGAGKDAPRDLSVLTRLRTAVQVSSTPPDRVTTESLRDRHGPSSASLPTPLHRLLQKEKGTAVPASPLPQRHVTAPRPSPHLAHLPAPDNTSVLAVTVGLQGMLGNHMFQYASLLGIAHRNGRRPFCSPDSGLHWHFHVTRVRDSHEEFTTAVTESNFASYDPRFEHLPHKNVLIGSYLQSWKYFHAIRDTIRQEFRFKPGVKDRAERMRDQHRNHTGRNVTVGVHVRRGDMALASSRSRGYYTAPVSYLVQAMDFMRHNHGDVIFIVVSDDPEWCKSSLPARSDYVIADPAPGPLHMALLASCNHVIMTAGTFGWWGGYLAGGDVVYYWDPKVLVHHPPLPVEIRRPGDYFPPSWVPLPGR